MHGYQLMDTISERTGGAWRPSPGAIYPTISQLEDEGLVRVDAEGGRKLVSLTDAGRAYLDEQGDRIGDPFTAMGTPGGGHNLRQAMEELRTAARAVAQSGSDTQVAAAQQILADARRNLYLLLADGPHEPDEPS